MFCSSSIRRKLRKKKISRRYCFLAAMCLVLVTAMCIMYLMVYSFHGDNNDGSDTGKNFSSVIPSSSYWPKKLLLMVKQFPISLCSQLQQQMKFLNRRKQRQLKVISYSVFGKDALKKYTSNIVSVAEETFASSLYKTWHVRIYTDLDLPVVFVERVKAINPLVRFIGVSQLNISAIFKTVHTRLHGKSAGKDSQKEDAVYTDLRLINGMVWRFHAMADTTVDIMCSRDLDSPLYAREEAAVREFLTSPRYLFLVMRDSPSHNSHVMGGMWCYKNVQDRLLGQILFTTVVRNSARRGPFYGEAPKGHDQYILNRHVWPVLEFRAMVHDSYYCHWSPGGRAFPTRRNFSTEPFVGCAARPCDYVKDVEVFRCPVRCRPRQHKDWEYC